MPKPTVAKSFRVRGNDREGFVIIDFADFSDRASQFVISPLAVDSLCDALRSAAAAVPAAIAVEKKSAGFQNRRRLRNAEEVNKQLSDLALENSFVVGLHQSNRKVWAKFSLPNKEIFELLLPIEDARRLCDGIGKAILALDAAKSDKAH